MLSPIVPVLMAGAMIAGTMYYVDGTKSDDLEFVLAKNFQIFHEKHQEDAIAQVAAKKALADAAGVDIPGTEDVEVVITPGGTTTTTTPKNNWTANPNAGGNSNGAGNSENSNAGGLGWGRNKTKTTTTTTEEVVEVIEGTDPVIAPTVEDAYTHFSTARDVIVSNVPGYSDMGNWESKVWAVDANTVAMISYPTPDASGNYAYAPEAYDTVLREAALRLSETSQGEHLVGRLGIDGVGGGYQVDGTSFSASGLNVPTNTPVIVTIWDQEL